MEGRLLLVSRNPLALAGITHALEARLPGVIIDIASSAERALALLTACDIDLVVFPSSLPNMPPLDFVRAAKALRPDSRVILVGEIDDIGLRAEVIREGAGFLAQPIVIDEFTAVLEQAFQETRYHQSA